VKTEINTFEGEIKEMKTEINTFKGEKRTEIKV
jgi:hypothetical protein